MTGDCCRIGNRYAAGETIKPIRSGKLRQIEDGVSLGRAVGEDLYGLQS